VSIEDSTSCVNTEVSLSICQFTGYTTPSGNGALIQGRAKELSPVDKAGQIAESDPFDLVPRLRMRGAVGYI
jgi:hypothetical protein